MKLLNAAVCSGQEPRSVEAVPECHLLAIRGRRFAFDALGLALYELEEQDREVPLATRAVASSLSPCGVFYNSVELHPSMACNLSCSYCFVDQNDCKMRMSLDTLKRFIAMFFPDPASLGHPVSFGYFGGEPLLNFGFIKESVEFLQEYFKGNATFGLTTNGTMIDDEIARFMSAYKFSSIIYSLDGPRHLHDEFRKFADGRGSYERVIQGLEILKGHGLARAITLRATFAASNPSIVERVKFLNEIAVDEGYAANISVEPVDSCGTENCPKQQSLYFDSNNVEFLQEEYLEAADYLIARAKAGKPMLFATVTNILGRIKNRKYNWSECGCTRGYVSLLPDGGLAACHRTKHTMIGDINKGGIDEAKAAAWADPRFYAREGCSSCWMRYLCGGGCRERSIAVNGDIRKPLMVNCAFMKMYVKTAIWILANLPGIPSDSLQARGT